MRLSRWLLSSISIFLFLCAGGTAYAISQTVSDSEDESLDSVVQSPVTLLESPYFHLRHHEGAHVLVQPVQPQPEIYFDLKMRTEYRNWFIGMGIGMDFPSSGWNPAYNFGTGSNMEIAYGFIKGWVMGVGMTFMNYSGSVYEIPLTDRDINLHWLTRISCGSGGIDPYFTAQAGEAWQTSTVYGKSVREMNPAMGVGAGVEFGLDSRFDLYGEGLLDFILNPQGTALDIPFSTGIRLKL